MINKKLAGACALLMGLVAGCVAMPERTAAVHRAFDFSRDSLAFANELEWEYVIDAKTGRISTREVTREPQFGHRCFAVVRLARQFFQYAQFEPGLPRASEAAYARAVREVHERRPGGGRVLIPGYADLRSFSADHAALLKEASGGAWRSYLQFSNWRMVFPFSRRHQEETAQRLLAQVSANRLPVLHLILFAPFPITKLDHAVMVISAVERPNEIQFSVYDPNNAQRPEQLTFDRASRTFIFPTTRYFADGPINLYEIYDYEID